MKMLAVATGSVLVLLMGAALAMGSPGDNSHARGGAGPKSDTPANPAPPAAAPGDNGSKPYEIPPAWGVTVCQDLKHTHGNAFGQCISATARGLQQPSLPARTACRSLRPSHHASRGAFRTCVRAVASTRRAARSHH